MKRYIRVGMVEKACTVYFADLNNKGFITGTIWHTNWKNSECGGVYHIKENGEQYYAIGTDDHKLVKAENKVGYRRFEFKYRMMYKLTPTGWDHVMMDIVEQAL